MQRRERSLPPLPLPLARVSRELQGLTGPALVLDGLQGLSQLRPGRRRLAVDGALRALGAELPGFHLRVFRV